MHGSPNCAAPSMHSVIVAGELTAPAVDHAVEIFFLHESANPPLMRDEPAELKRGPRE
jgi:hypothetical protein